MTDFKEQLIYACIDQIKEDIEGNDIESLFLLLDYLYDDDLLGFLSNNRQNEFLN